MTNDPFPPCQGPDPAPTRAKFTIPAGAIDSHAHIFGTPEQYDYSPRRGYTPPPATLDDYRRLHQALGGIDRAVLTQPSVYGTDNTCMMDAVAAWGEGCRAVVAVDADITDRALQEFHEQGARGARVNIVDKGGNPFSDIAAVRRFTERLKDLGCVRRA